jgi:hypothetical protein
MALPGIIWGSGGGERSYTCRVRCTLTQMGSAVAKAVATTRAIIRAAQARARRPPWKGAGRRGRAGVSRGWLGVAFWYVLALFGSWGALAH